MLFAVGEVQPNIWATLLPILGLCVGGLGGSIFTFWYTGYRAKSQPVSYVLKTQKLFGDHQAVGELHLSVVAYDPTNSMPDPEHFDHLFLIELEIVNNGNSDIKEFTFGITFNDADRILFCQYHGTDRHHVITSDSHPTVTIPLSRMDFTCTPFNRSDSYSIILYVAPAINETRISKPEVTSPHPVKLTLAPNTSEFLVDAASGVAMKVLEAFLPFSIRLK